MMKRILLASALTVVIYGAATAQIFPPGYFGIDGIPVGCGPVFTEVHASLPDIALAVPAGMGAPPRILINGPMFASLPTGVKLFIYAHECFHHITGPSEAAADCYAVKLGRNQGALSLPVLQQICQAVFFSPGDWTHFPGPVRCQQMLACYHTP
ncbi:MAG TPA: hypothetical protein VGE72_25570 [Azospirillum sp.]